MCLMATAQAGDLTIQRATVAADAPHYSTMEEARDAAIESLRAFKKERSEYGGIIVRHEDGRYQVSTPVTSGRGGELSYAIPKELRSKMVASYHSHPWVAGGTESHKPSKQDLATAKKYGLPMYILDMGSDRTIETDGRKTKTHKD